MQNDDTKCSLSWVGELVTVLVGLIWFSFEVKLAHCYGANARPFSLNVQLVGKGSKCWIEVLYGERPFTFLNFRSSTLTPLRVRT